MKSFKEALRTLLAACRYSILFCLKNSKKETAARIVFSVILTVTSYIAVQSTGWILNAVQSNFGSGRLNLTDRMIFWPLALLIAVMIISASLRLLNWYYRSTWNHQLRFASERELEEFRASLDITRMRSKVHDDLCRRIEELPAGWNSRIGFSEELMQSVTLVSSTCMFGASLIWYKPLYALILIVACIPMVAVEFRLVCDWWNLFEELIPANKVRGMLQRPYRAPIPFLQALTFNQLPPLRQEIDGNVREVLGRYDRLRKRCVGFEVISDTVAVIGLVAVIVLAISAALAGKMSIGTFTIVFVAARTFQGNIENLVNMLANQWNNAKGIVLLEEEYFRLKPALKTDDPVFPEFSSPPLITLSGVSFRYPDTEREVLKDVSFTIEPGTKVAIVGKSGNGKSTLLHLLMRHYDPSEGSILVNGLDLRQIPPDHWSEYATAMMQEFSIMERTVGAELASSRLGEAIDDDRVHSSARFAAFEDVVMDDPNGFNIQIGTEFGGREFSGGERKRLALARAHYRKTPVFILDEPDEKLDPESAEKVMDGVFALKGITVIIITHHVSRAERCDKVIVMGKGEVIECGNPLVLIEEGGVFATMYQKDRDRLRC